MIKKYNKNNIYIDLIEDLGNIISMKILMDVLV